MVDLSAKQLIQRHVQRLALDIPAGHIQRAHAAEHRAAAALAPKGFAHHFFPDRLGIEGVGADEHGRQLLEHTVSGISALAVSQRAFAEAVKALIGINLGDYGAPGASAFIHALNKTVEQQQLNFNNFHLTHP
ncbi:hypothetical protein SDC9_187690 [bioreactor metagenome]|uniref:Uncharacterized protein n=1 Tax=bioreactor metagenome TaxID=1076179 RepID=A0A645HVF9_9ZZZZ